MWNFFLVCIGGAIGTGARYLIFEIVAKYRFSSFAYATLAVNALGSFLIGVAFAS